ncbi:ABC transporter family protein/ peptidase C39 domain-containing protein [Synechococcus sp. MIT S9220]|uniref:ABC transporter transmembrane domain-containing protein n=1 Tax=unclassified Synechococcus TaxID=2626047 RepID=UPI00164AB5D2|nr:ABC transporter transmembrane domain-containing protein [Synechococcus sp. MIT S9220]NOL47640.1 ATP-binding cassette domain-containing protein [Synechococcus sp. MIT S9220]QNJ21967.1 ABC transporter family protein/ peptidase C39 domain-containing protein [Synechococcus sp. MIT S9220]
MFPSILGLPANPKTRPLFQSDESECGLVCLAMMAKSFKLNVSLQQIRAIYGSCRGGINASQLQRLAEHIGIRIVVHDTNNKEELLNELDLPTIVCWKSNHFILILEKTDTHFIAHDPATGFLEIEKQTLAHCIDQYALVGRKIDENSAEKKAQQSPKTPAIWLTSLKQSFSASILTVIALLLIIIATFELANAQILNIFFTWVIELNLPQWSRSLAISQVVIAIISGVGTFLLFGCVCLGISQLSLKLNQYFYRKLIRLPENYFLSRHTGDISAKFESLDQLLLANQSSLITLLIAAINLLILFFILLATSFWLFIFIAILMIIIITASLVMIPVQVDLQQENQQSLAKNQADLYQIINGYDQIKMEGQEHFHLSRYAQSLIIAHQSENLLNITYAQQNFFLGLVDSLSTVVLLLAASLLILNGQITLGQYAALDALVSLSLAPLSGLVTTIQNLQETLIAYKRLEDLTTTQLDGRYNPKFNNQPVVAINQSQELTILQLNQVSFKYSLFSRKILERASLNLNASAFPIAIAADQSSGKTTLGKLLAGRIRPGLGMIKIFGENIHQQSGKRLNQLVLMVESEPLLFQNTLLFNLDPFQTSSYEQIMTIVEKLGVGKLNLFRDLNRQLNDVKTLSGGEKVILQVIRCLIREPKILVIDNVLDSLPATLKDGFIQGIIKYQQNSIFLVDQDNDLLEKVHAFALINGQVGRLRSKQE